MKKSISIWLGTGLAEDGGHRGLWGRVRETLPISSHLFAGILLTLFALSHLAYLRISGVEGGLPNPVFPFLTSNNLYLAAALLEGGTALVCFIRPGRDATNILILAFISLMVVYGWAFRFVGGVYCHCLGLLGRLLHTTKTEEWFLPKLALLYLFLTTLPWVYPAVSGLVKGRGVRITVLIFSLALMPARTYCQGRLEKAIEIFGEYQGMAQNPDTEKVYNDQRDVRASFSVLLGDGGVWLLRATNLENGKFEEIWNDATNIYTLQASGPTNLATVSESKVFLGFLASDSIRISLPWLTYCLSPSRLAVTDTGVAYWPVPWMGPRLTQDAYGYKWLISASRDGRFVSTLSLVRDSSLDLSDEKAFLRPDFVYPVSPQFYHADKMDLQRLRYITNGWISTKFQCTEWLGTNGLEIPWKSKFERYRYKPGFPYPYPFFRAEINAENVAFHEVPMEDFVPPVGQATKVYDFRYRRATSKRIYRFANYTLQAGEPWKSSSDPALLAQVNDYLKRGPRYDVFMQGSKRNFIAWLPFGLVIGLAGTVILWSKKRNKKTQ